MESTDRRRGEPLHLGDQAGLGVLGDHQARVDPGVTREEGRQSEAAIHVEETVGAPLAHRRDVSERDREEVEHVPDRRAVEVTVARERPVGRAPKGYRSRLANSMSATLWAWLKVSRAAP